MSNWQQFLSKKTAEDLQQYKQQRRDYDKNYREANKERLHERVVARLIPHTCEVCGQQYSKHNRTRHLQSKAHRRAMGEDAPNKKTGPSKRAQTKHEQLAIDIDALIASATL